MRRVISFLLLIVLVCTVFSGTALAADPQFTGTIGAKAWMLLDADSGRVLESSNNADDRIEPASTTKILTLLVALEKGNMSDEVTISAKAAGMGGSSCELKNGAKINMKNLLTAMMMFSGNDAATAVAEHISGSVEGFVELMNAKAKELGMNNSNFVTPHGMHNENHYSTLNDMAKVTMAAMKNTAFMEIVNRASFTLPENNRTYINTNQLMVPDNKYYYAYATGMKTGSTKIAGACLVASASHDGMNLICLLFNYPEENSNYRWPAAQELFDFGFNSYKTVSLADVAKDLPPVQVPVENCAITDEKGGLLEFAQPGKGVSVTLPKEAAQGLIDGTDSVEVKTVFAKGDKLLAPIQKDEVLGTVTYTSKNTGATLYSGPLVATRDVLQAGTESNVQGGTAVTKMPPMIPEAISDKKGQGGIWLWLLIPVGLIGFLVFRLLTQNHKRRKRFAPRKKPQYSYKIRR